jgi:hypothetical protein
MVAMDTDDLRKSYTLTRLDGFTDEYRSLWAAWYILFQHIKLKSTNIRRLLPLVLAGFEIYTHGVEIEN